LIGGTQSTAPVAGLTAFDCFSALTLSSQARVEQSKERDFPDKKNYLLVAREGNFFY